MYAQRPQTTSNLGLEHSSGFPCFAFDPFTGMSTSHPLDPPPGFERQGPQPTINTSMRLPPGLFQLAPVLPTTRSTGHRHNAPLAQQWPMKWQSHQIMNNAVNAGLRLPPGLFQLVPIVPIRPAPGLPFDGPPAQMSVETEAPKIISNTSIPPPPRLFQLVPVPPIRRPPGFNAPPAQSSMGLRASQTASNAGMSHSSGILRVPVVTSTLTQKVEPFSPEYWADILKDHPNPANLTPSPNSLPPTPHPRAEMGAWINEAWHEQSYLPTTNKRYLYWESRKLSWEARMLEQSYRARSKFYDLFEGWLGWDGKEKEYGLRPLREQYLRNRERWLWYKQVRYGFRRGGRRMREAESERVKSFGWCGGLVHAYALQDVLDEIAREGDAEWEEDYMHSWSEERTARYFANEDRYIDDEEKRESMTVEEEAVPETFVKNPWSDDTEGKNGVSRSKNERSTQVMVDSGYGGDAPVFFDAPENLWNDDRERAENHS